MTYLMDLSIQELKWGKSNMIKKENVVQDDRFTFANESVVLHDQKLATKPRGYFKDAFIRFTKNKASVVAAVIIGIIALFAIITPLATPKGVQTLMDPYYSKKGPRSEALYSLGINGSKQEELSNRTLIYQFAKGVGADFTEEKPVETIKESMKSDYQPVIKIKKAEMTLQGRTQSMLYTASVDQYLSEGFKYFSIEQSMYQKILDWENETGLKVIYPLIAENEYTFDSTGKDAANYWYKTQGKCDPVKIIGGKAVVQSYDENLVLEENYMRDSSGNFVITSILVVDNQLNLLNIKLEFYIITIIVLCTEELQTIFSELIHKAIL